jgi:uncharacterized protein YndB with AHSA1/START domain
MKEDGMTGHVAVAETEINASPGRVWSALTDPAQIEEYMFGSRVTTDWKQGSPIVWKGEYEGRKYEDRGQILEIEPQRRLRMTHFSPLSGREDAPENYHTLVFELEQAGHEKTHLSLSQDNNSTEEEAEHSKSNWETMLNGLKQLAERG